MRCISTKRFPDYGRGLPKGELTSHNLRYIHRWVADKDKPARSMLKTLRKMLSPAISGRLVYSCPVLAPPLPKPSPRRQTRPARADKPGQPAPTNPPTKTSLPEACSEPFGKCSLRRFLEGSCSTVCSCSLRLPSSVAPHFKT